MPRITKAQPEAPAPKATTNPTAEQKKAAKVSADAAAKAKADAAKAKADKAAKKLADKAEADLVKAAAKAEKENAKIAAKAAKEADKKKAEAEKAAASKAAIVAAKAEATEKLPALAHEITERLDRADVAGKQADDHRLAAAIRLAEAEVLTKAAGMPLEKWFDTNIKDKVKGRTFEAVRKLLYIGRKGEVEGAKALADARSASAKASKKNRDKTKEPVVAQIAAPGAVSDADQLAQAKEVARKNGLVVVPKSVADAGAVSASGSPAEQMMVLFKGLDMPAKLAILGKLADLASVKIVSAKVYADFSDWRDQKIAQG